MEKGEILNLTNICLSPESNAATSKAPSAQFYIKKGGVEYLVYPLTAERNQATINVFLRFDDEAELIVKGQGKVTIMGYYSVDESPMDMRDIDSEDEEEQGEDIGDDEEDY